jgi:hypothetical protein
MNITLDGCEVIIPVGGYEDKDDMICRGCGKEIGMRYHTVVDCLRTLREAIIELQKQVPEEKRQVQLYGREDIETMNKPETEEGK